MNQDIVVTVDMVKAMGVCGVGLRWVRNNPNLTVAENIRLATEQGRQEDIDWWKSIVTTEEFVRYRGKEITMGSYQVFNPFTGTHELCETEAEAKQKIFEITKTILETNKVYVCQELKNELGDAIWIPVEVPNTYSIVPTT